MRIETALQPRWGWKIIWWRGRVAPCLPNSSPPSFRMTGLCNPITLEFVSADNCSSTHTAPQNSLWKDHIRPPTPPFVSHDHNLICCVEIASFCSSKPAELSCHTRPYVNRQRFLTDPRQKLYLGLGWDNQILFRSHPGQCNCVFKRSCKHLYYREGVCVSFSYPCGVPSWECPSGCPIKLSFFWGGWNKGF